MKCLFYELHDISVMLSRMGELLIRPDRFFLGIAQARENLVPPLIIVGAGSAISLAGMMIVSTFPGDYTGLMDPGVVLMQGLLPLIEWVFISAALYALARLFSGTGTFRATLQNIGYALLPMTCSILVGVLVSIGFRGGPRVLYPGPWLYILFAGSVVYYLLILWSCILWVFAVRHTHRISPGKSLASVLILVVLSVFAFYASAFGYIPSLPGI